VVGLAALPASQLAGLLYGLDHRLPFLVGAACALCAAALMLVVRLDTPEPVPVD